MQWATRPFLFFSVVADLWYVNRSFGFVLGLVRFWAIKSRLHPWYFGLAHNIADLHFRAARSMLDIFCCYFCHFGHAMTTSFFVSRFGLVVCLGCGISGGFSSGMVADSGRTFWHLIVVCFSAYYPLCCVSRWLALDGTQTGNDMHHVITVHACALPKPNRNRCKTVVPSSFALPSSHPPSRDRRQIKCIVDIAGIWCGWSSTDRGMPQSRPPTKLTDSRQTSLNDLTRSAVLVRQLSHGSVTLRLCPFPVPVNLIGLIHRRFHSIDEKNNYM